jgi:hypothetical protein
MNPRPLGYELDPTAPPQATQARTSLYSLAFSTVGGNCRPPETAHGCHPFVIQFLTQGSRRLGDEGRLAACARRMGMDFDPRDYDSRDDERHSRTPNRGGRGGSSDRDADWSQPANRPRDRDDETR